MSRISGPLLDGIDMQVEVPAHYRDLRSPAEGESDIQTGTAAKAVPKPSVSGS
jgi:predicted ATPase with chaperone activity